MSHEEYGIAAEKFLINSGHTMYISIERRRVLGCLGCWFGGAEAIGEQPGIDCSSISRCTDISKDTIYSTLRGLEAKGFLVSEKIPSGTANKGRRKIYHPSDSDKGKALISKLEVPNICLLETFEKLGPFFPASGELQDLDIFQDLDCER
jgi:DNA-binding MarR family transcriptional regulator